MKTTQKLIFFSSGDFGQGEVWDPGFLSNMNDFPVDIPIGSMGLVCVKKVFPKIVKNPKIDDLGVLLFLETPIYLGLSPLPVTVANEGLGWDSLLKM